MEKKKNYEILLLFLLCVSVNFIGKLIAEKLELPVWLDSVGTMYAAYFAGPLAAGILGIATNIMYGPLASNAYPYMVVNLSVGLIAGFAAKKGMLKKSFNAFSCGLLIAVVSAILSTILNILTAGGLTGNLWGDSVIAYLKEAGFIDWLAELIGEFYVDLPDKVLSVLLTYWAVLIYGHVHTDKKKSGKTRTAAAAVLFVCLLSSELLIPGSPVLTARAAEETQENAAETAEAGTKMQENAAETAEAGTKAQDGEKAAGEASAVTEETEEEALALEKRFSSYVQTIYNGNNGIPGGEVNDIEQASNGILWIGTYGGLYKYDGKSFELMSGMNSVKNVTCLYTDVEGRLWIGTNDNGISICTNNEISNTLDESMGLSSDSVRCIIRSSNGLYYIGTVDALDVIELYDGLHVTAVLKEIQGAESMSVSEDGYFACTTSDGSLYLLKDEEILETLKDGDNLNYSCVLFDGSTLYAGTSGQEVRVFTLSDGRLIPAGSIRCEGMTGINSILKDGDVFLLASDSGIGYFTENTGFSEIGTSSFGSSVDTILVDYQGNYWFTSSRLGLLKLSESIFTETTSYDGFREDVVNAFTEWNGAYYYGTDSGLQISDARGSKAVENELTESLSGVRIRCLTESSDGALWIASYGKGAIRVDRDGSIEQLTSEDGLAGDRVRACLELSDGRLAFATTSGVSVLSADGSFTNTGTAEGLTNAVVLCLSEKDGVLYAGTDGGGINLIQDGELIGTVTKKDGLSSNIILRIVGDPSGENLFIVTGSGIDRIDSEGKVSAITEFPYYNNFDIFFTDGGKMWVTSSAGIYIVSEDAVLGNSPNMDYELLDSRKGLRKKFTANSWNYLDDEGNLYLCCDTGVVSVNISDYDNLKASYRFALETISVDGNIAGVDKENTNTISRDAVKIEFFPKVVNYSVNDPYVGVWLEGFDEGPIITLQSELESMVYTNLGSGKYTFHLAIYDSDMEHVLEEMTYTFLKENEFYDNWWFSLYIFGIAAVLLVYFVWAIVATQINKNLELQRKEIENLRLKQTADTVLAASEAKDRFLALMSHDIRTPINAILGMNEMILRENTDPGTLEYATDIKAAGNTLLSLVNSILDFSKIEGGKMDLVPVVYSTGVLFRNLVNGVKQRAEEKGLSFLTEIDPSIPCELYGDDIRITQVISNLLTNAVKYTEKGYIRFSVREEQRNGEETVLYVSVEDSGIGIRDEDRDKLFESFKRLDEERNRNIEGTGLGMPIVLNLLELMGSSLEVNSTYGVGSTFSFRLSQHIVDASMVGSIENYTLGEKEAKKEGVRVNSEADILVVDDNEMNRKVIRGFLKLLGIEPVLAGSGAEALEFVRGAHFDLIFMDHMMPVMDGIETLKRMRAGKLPEDTRVVVLTANAIIGAKEEYLRNGFDDYLSKPVDYEKLTDLLARYIPAENGAFSGNAAENVAFSGTAENGEDTSKKETAAAAFGNGSGGPETTEQEPEKETQDSGNAEAEPSYAVLKYCPELDVKTGILYAADSEELYEEILQEYVRDDRTEKLNELLGKEDYENYRILVHAVKSNSKTIGADRVSELAKKQEYACRDQRTEELRAGHGAFAEAYGDLLLRLGKYVREKEDNRNEENLDSCNS